MHRSIAEFISHNYFETKGSGKATFLDGFSINADFAFEMKANGQIQDKLTFFDIDNYLGLFDHLNVSSLQEITK